jgi:hypothetical protein
MSKNRRDFIKGTAVVGLVGVSGASAKTQDSNAREKKISERKQARRAIAPLATPSKILVVSMVPFSKTIFETKFLTGANIVLPDAIYSVSDNSGKGLGYKDSDLQAAISAADSNTLVVTVGGLAVAKAAKAVGTKRYISIVGDTTGFLNKPSGNFLGGISVESANQDANRISNVKTKSNVKDNTICLLFNSNSAMQGTEGGFFKNSHTQNADIDGSTANPQTAFSNAIAKIKAIKDPQGNPLINAVIVSADPFYTLQRQALVAAAKG